MILIRLNIDTVRVTKDLYLCVRYPLCVRTNTQKYAGKALRTYVYVHNSAAHAQQMLGMCCDYPRTLIHISHACACGVPASA